MAYWIDSHFHPQYYVAGENMTASSVTAFKEGLQKIEKGLMVSIRSDDKALLKNLSLEHQHLQWSLGIHPCHTHEENKEAFITLCTQDPSFNALGETGLDYYHEFSPELARSQQDFFHTHLELGRLLKKPLIVHTRQASEDTLATLRHFQGVRGVIHCFTESLDFAKKVVDLGWMISFSGILTFPKATELHNVARYLPWDVLMIETDAPYLTPVPFRGKTNYPHFVQHVGEYLSHLKNTPIEHAQDLLKQNYSHFLSLNV